MRGPLFSLPSAMFLGVIFFIAIFFLFIFVQVGMVSIAFSKLGLTPAQGFLLLISTLIGSGFNIPVYRSDKLVPNIGFRKMRMFNSEAGEDFTGRSRSLVNQVISVNFGGCIIPVLLSLSLLSRTGFDLSIFLCIALVSAAAYALARPVAGVGIGIPVLIPPLVTAVAAILLTPVEIAPIAAYVAGSLGTLIGADLFHLMNPATRRILDAPVLSIGGAGTFDGIFITGILAVLLA